MAYGVAGPHTLGTAWRAWLYAATIGNCSAIFAPAIASLRRTGGRREEKQSEFSGRLVILVPSKRIFFNQHDELLVRLLGLGAHVTSARPHETRASTTISRSQNNGRRTDARSDQAVLDEEKNICGRTSAMGGRARKDRNCRRS